VLNAENSQPLIFRLFTDKLERSWWRLSNRHSVDDVERLRLPTSPTFAAVVVEPTTEWQHSSGPDATLLYNYALPSSPTCRWLWGSVNTSSSPRQRVTDLTTPTTYRCLRHVPDDTVSWRHVATQRSVDACSPSTTRSSCRHCELATPLGYSAYFSCLLKFNLLLILVV